MNICCCRTFIRHFLISLVSTSSSFYSVNEIMAKLMKKLAYVCVCVCDTEFYHCVQESNFSYKCGSF